jgi:hypothetical protein
MHGCGRGTNHIRVSQKERAVRVCRIPGGEESVTAGDRWNGCREGGKRGRNGRRVAREGEDGVE